MRLPLPWVALAGLLVFAPEGSARVESAPAPALPEGVTPLPPESARHFQELLEAAETYRGLKALRPVPAGTLAEPELRKKMAESLREDLSPQQLDAAEIAAKAFGLIPESLDLSRYLTELLTSQVAGFYDPIRRYLALVRRGGNGAAGAEEDVIVVHELTHALQDQHFDLRRFEAIDPMSDAATARQALAEGDATLTMTSYLAGKDVAAVPGVGDAMKAWLADPEALAGSDVPGGAELAKAPAWIRDSLLFSYVQGFTFCLEVRRAGGQKLLDAAFTSDPPRSSEQILHPEKWSGGGRRDDPIVLRWPDLAAELPAWKQVSEGELGEASMRSLLRQGAGSRETADAAAAGWGGDRFAVYQRQGRRLLLWWTEWDAESDAREFLAAMDRLGGGWRAEALSPRRVLAVRGELEEPQRAAIRARLAAAETVPRPAAAPADSDCAKSSGKSKLPEKLQDDVSGAAAWRALGGGSRRASTWRGTRSVQRGSRLNAATRLWCACRKRAPACSAWAERRRAPTG